MNKPMKYFISINQDFRPLPFWSWNDDLNIEQLKEQINAMKSAGIGGFFMHARGGLITEYMGKKWHNCIKACVEEAEKLGMHAWLYDENGWPSGAADGKVTEHGPEHFMKWLQIDNIKHPSTQQNKNILAVYKKTINGYQLTQSQDTEAKVLCYYEQTPYYIDILNKETVSLFIQHTHEVYYNHFKDKFGSSIIGFFTDEPQYAYGRFPYSQCLPEAFEKQYGYGFIENLPMLFYEYGNYYKFRYDYWLLVNKLIVNAFMQQIFTYCNNKEVAITGHIMAEDSIQSQMAATAGVMPFYEYMSIPGIDWLGRKVGSPVTPKQVGSVAQQLGKKRVLSEMFAQCGWDVSFDELKWIAIWQFINGVNLACQHLESFTIRGARKRDHPPSLFIQQPWWEEYCNFNDFIAGLGQLLAENEACCPVLLIHPLRSGYLTYTGKYNERIAEIDACFLKATECLSNTHIEHHYGDETIIDKYARIDADHFIIGNCSYKAVVLPKLLTVSEHTFALLTEFGKNGGQIYAFEDLPAYIDGRLDSRIKTLNQFVVGIDNYNTEALRKFSPISITENGSECPDIHFTMRYTKQGRIFVLLNLSNQESHLVNVQIENVKTVEFLDLVNCECWQIDMSSELFFRPMQSYILKECADKKTFLGNQKRQNIVLSNQWKITASDLNVLTLDYCDFMLENGVNEKHIPIICLQNKLLELKKAVSYQLTQHFYIDTEPKFLSQLYFCMENPEKVELYLNGEKIPDSYKGFWLDSSIKKINILPYTRQGENEILIKGIFTQPQKVYDVLFGEQIHESEKNKLTYDTELESTYIIGDFRLKSDHTATYGERKAILVDKGFKIAKSDTLLTGSEITTQGYLFFRGKMLIEQHFHINKITKPVYFQIKELYAPTANVYINGRKAGAFLFTPFERDITDYVKQGENVIAIELFSSNRNTLGPHHHYSGELHRVTPLSFSDKIPFYEQPRPDYFRNDYCFVKFGFEL